MSEFLLYLASEMTVLHLDGVSISLHAAWSVVSFKMTFASEMFIGDFRGTYFGGLSLNDPNGGGLESDILLIGIRLILETAVKMAGFLHPLHML